jgi:hypothetical protein
MVEDEDILDVLDRQRDDLDRAVKSLVAAANRGGGEDNITAVAFRVAPGEALEETQRLPAQVEPDEETREAIPTEPAVDTMVIPPDRIEAELLQPGSAEARAAARRDGVDTGARVRLALTMVALLALAVALLAWGLLR